MCVCVCCLSVSVCPLPRNVEILMKMKMWRTKFNENQNDEKFDLTTSTILRNFLFADRIIDDCVRGVGLCVCASMFGVEFASAYDLHTFHSIMGDVVVHDTFEIR